MARRTLASLWAHSVERSLSTWAREGARIGKRQVGKALETSRARHKPPPGAGDWVAGVAMGMSRLLRFHVYRPPGLHAGERVPLMVMLHGCGQDAKGFALSTRMNRLADQQRFLVLYPEQDRVSNPQGCWNWFDTRGGRAHHEAALIMKAVDQVCLFYPADGTRIALAGLSAGASMAALLATRYPLRFKAVVMHSGVPPGVAESTATAVVAMQGRRLVRPLPQGPALPPLMVIHGRGDAVVSSRNAHAAVNLWARAAGAEAGAPREVQRGQRHGMTITDYLAGRRRVATLVDVATLGHAWSGGAARKPYSDSRGPDASRMAWSFAARQFNP